MFKTFNLCGLALLFVLISISFVYPQTSTEQLVITTYYPSPFGSYADLTANRMKIGSSYSGAGTPFVNNALLVEGNIAIARTTAGNTLDVNGGIRVSNLAAASATTVCRDGNNDLSTCSSSKKFKEDIQPLTNQDYDKILTEIASTPLYSFKMKTEGPKAPRHLGVLAEESPQTLRYIDEHGNTNIDFYSYQGAYPWAAVKALVNKIENLETEVKNLKSELSRPK